MTGIASKPMMGAAAAYVDRIASFLENRVIGSRPPRESGEDWVDLAHSQAHAGELPGELIVPPCFNPRAEPWLEPTAMVLALQRHGPVRQRGRDLRDRAEGEAAGTRLHAAGPRMLEATAGAAMWLAPESSPVSGKAAPVTVNQNGLSVGTFAMDCGGGGAGPVYVGDDYYSYYFSQTWHEGNFLGSMSGYGFFGSDYFGAGGAVHGHADGGAISLALGGMINVAGNIMLRDAGPAHPAERDLIAHAFAKPAHQLNLKDYRWLEVNSMRETAGGGGPGFFGGIGLGARIGLTRTRERSLRLPLPVDEATRILESATDGDDGIVASLLRPLTRYVSNKLEAWEMCEQRVHVPTLDEALLDLQVGQQLTSSVRRSWRFAVAAGGVSPTTPLSIALNAGFVGVSIRMEHEAYVMVRRTSPNHVLLVWAPADGRVRDASISSPIGLQLAWRDFSAHTCMQAFRLDTNTREGQHWYRSIIGGDLPQHDLHRAAIALHTQASAKSIAPQLMALANKHLPTGVRRVFLRVSNSRIALKGGGYHSWFLWNGANRYGSHETDDRMTCTPNTAVASRETRDGYVSTHVREGNRRSAAFTCEHYMLDTHDPQHPTELEEISAGTYYVGGANGVHGATLQRHLRGFGVAVNTAPHFKHGGRHLIRLSRRFHPKDRQALTRLAGLLRGKDASAAKQLADLSHWLLPDAPRQAVALAAQTRRALYRLQADASVAPIKALVHAQGWQAAALLHWLCGGDPADVVLELETDTWANASDAADRVAFRERLPIDGQAPARQVMARFAAIEGGLEQINGARNTPDSLQLLPLAHRNKVEGVLTKKAQTLRKHLTLGLDPTARADLSRRVNHFASSGLRRNSAAVRAAEYLDPQDGWLVALEQRGHALLEQGSLAQELTEQALLGDCVADLRHGNDLLNAVDGRQKALPDNNLYDTDRAAGLQQRLGRITLDVSRWGDLSQKRADGRPIASDATLVAAFDRLDIWQGAHVPLLLRVQAELQRRHQQ